MIEISWGSTMDWSMLKQWQIGFAYDNWYTFNYQYVV